MAILRRHRATTLPDLVRAAVLCVLWVNTLHWNVFNCVIRGVVVLLAQQRTERGLLDCLRMMNLNERSSPVMFNMVPYDCSIVYILSLNIPYE